MEGQETESQRQGSESRGKTPDRLDAAHQQRRGSSSLLSAAGIGYEHRRRLSQQTAEVEGRIFQQGNEVFMQDKDGKMTRLEVVEVHEKMGLLRKAVPTLPIVFAVLFCICNTVFPGSGTAFGALCVLCCGKTRHDKVSTGVKYGLIAAALQLFTAIFIVGWIYSIVYGVNMIQDSLTKDSRSSGGGTGDETSPAKSGADVEANKSSEAFA